MSDEIYCEGEVVIYDEATNRKIHLELWRDEEHGLFAVSGGYFGDQGTEYAFNPYTGEDTHFPDPGIRQLPINAQRTVSVQFNMNIGNDNLKEKNRKILA